jgi:hypothetical protein
MAAAAAGMHPPYHDLTYYAKRCTCGTQVTGTMSQNREQAGETSG